LATPEHFDSVVVGSGFGGSVSAFRLAEGGHRVCLLERGKPYPPGSFPRSPRDTSRNFWDPSEGLHGMYDLWSFRGIDALVSSGLGGGSLIYANVFIRKDERWFVKEDLDAGGFEYWPFTRADLEPHYDRVESMIRPQRYPFGDVPYSNTPKTRAFKQAAEQLGLDFQFPHLAVTFANDGRSPVPGEEIVEQEPNLHGAKRFTCQLVGECDVGCNWGAKNSLDFNYLSAAERRGADLRTRCEVRSFEPRAQGGYTIRYVHHRPDREGAKTDTRDPAVVPERVITANRLIIAAGALGSPFLLLKNRAALPGLSRVLGSRFCGNADLLTFAARCRNGQDEGTASVLIDAARGPVITSAIRFPDDQDGGEGRGFYLQDAGFPQFAAWLLQTVDAPHTLSRGARAVAQVLRQRLTGNPHSNLSGVAAGLLSDTELADGTLPLLGMGRDIPNGTMRLRRGNLDLDWRTSKSGPYFDRVRAASREVAHAMGATSFRDNPLWYLRKVITVHPLGGCPVGRNPQEGVVDPCGRVFGYPGLYVADGSVMPGPVGPNPSLTIPALADRFADGILAEGR
jgi:cholesterol oxidase